MACHFSAFVTRICSFHRRKQSMKHHPAFNINHYVIYFLFDIGDRFNMLCAFFYLQKESTTFSPEHSFSHPTPPVEWHLTQDPEKFDILTVGFPLPFQVLSASILLLELIKRQSFGFLNNLH